jgi:DNA-binding MarR family transcriptional regulator
VALTSTGYLSGRFLLELDRAADTLLQVQLGISYKRALFLLVLQQGDTVTQHQLALALGYSDPAVSMMLVELVKEGYVQTAPSAMHRRKRLVTITPQGSALAATARQMLDAHFDQLLLLADVDAQEYRALIERLYQALITKQQKEQAR